MTLMRSHLAKTALNSTYVIMQSVLRIQLGNHIPFI